MTNGVSPGREKIIEQSRGFVFSFHVLSRAHRDLSVSAVPGTEALCIINMEINI